MNSIYSTIENNAVEKTPNNQKKRMLYATPKLSKLEASKLIMSGTQATAESDAIGGLLQS
jgi:hypothetical protein